MSSSEKSTTTQIDESENQLDKKKKHHHRKHRTEQDDDNQHHHHHRHDRSGTTEVQTIQNVDNDAHIETTQIDEFEKQEIERKDEEDASSFNMSELIKEQAILEIQETEKRIQERHQKEQQEFEKLQQQKSRTSLSIPITTTSTDEPLMTIQDLFEVFSKKEKSFAGIQQLLAGQSIPNLGILKSHLKETVKILKEDKKKAEKKYSGFHIYFSFPHKNFEI